MSDLAPAATASATLAPVGIADPVRRRKLPLGLWFGIGWLGLVIFLPTLVVLAVVTDFRIDVLAALLGTVAGYVLSQSTADGE